MIHHAQETLAEHLAEHDRYTVWVAAWAQISGFRECLAIDESCKPGDHNYVQPATGTRAARQKSCLRSM